MGGTAQWVYHDGQRLTAAMLHDFLLLDADFYRRTGQHLKISSGVRTDQEQENIWYARMVTANNIRGRRVYETRWWNGQMWYRISSEGTVAPPGSSNHQINVAAGRRGALDLRDTGSDAGILTRGSFRARVFDQIAPSYGYDSEGYAFGETWHKRYNRDPWRAVPGQPVTPTNNIPEDEDMSIAVRLNKTHLFHIGYGKIKHLNKDTMVKGNHNVGAATLTMRIVQPDDRWIEMSTAEFLEQLDSFLIPRSVVDTKTGYVRDVSKDSKDSRGEFTAGGAWSWERAAYQNSLGKPAARY